MFGSTLTIKFGLFQICVIGSFLCSFTNKFSNVCRFLRKTPPRLKEQQLTNVWEEWVLGLAFIVAFTNYLMLRVSIRLSLIVFKFLDIYKFVLNTYSQFFDLFYYFAIGFLCEYSIKHFY